MMRIDVLLASYNGERHLRQQLDSVLAQQGVDLCIYVRDDGSSDATPALLRSYAERFPDKVVLVSAGEGRRGAAGNFLGLMQLDSSADYFAFCDQDDVWAPDRLQVAVTMLEDLRKPVRLYCSAVSFVSEDLQVLGVSSRKVLPSFDNAFVENIAQGCTMVGDAALRDLVRARPPQIVAMHDWWLYLLATALGQVVYDPVPRLLYRQHGANAVGGGFSLWQKLRKNWRRYTTGRAWPMAAQADHFLALYPDRLTTSQQHRLRAFVAGKSSFLARLRLVASMRLRRQSLLETAVVKILLFINAY